jgi:tetratricopeptide (TPR) repeat protein
MFPDRHWQDLAKQATRDEEISWKAERTADYFSGLLFLREAEARVRARQSYPASWIRFVEAGIRAPAINTRPAGLSAELAKLALLEGRSAASLHLVEETWKLLGGWAPHMSGIYRIERDLALILGKLQDSQKLQDEAKERIKKRSEILIKHLGPVEQMTQLPVLAEAFYALGDSDKAQKNWKIATDLCSQNQNPESQSAGLTQIWMSYARANTWPSKETQASLERIEKQLPSAYSKVNF